MTRHRRPQYNAVVPYLIVEGAEACMQFCREVLGMTIEEDDRNEDGSVMHALLRLEDSVIEISDAREGTPALPSMLHVYVDDVDARYEAAKKAGVETIMPPTQMPYGERSCGFTDAWGIQWWLATCNDDAPADPA